MVDTTIDLDLSLRDLIAVINDFQFSDGKFLFIASVSYLTHTITGPVNVQSVISALVARSNAKRATSPIAAVTLSRPESSPSVTRSAPSRGAPSRSIPPRMGGVVTDSMSRHVLHRVDTAPNPTASGSAPCV